MYIEIFVHVITGVILKKSVALTQPPNAVHLKSLITVGSISLLHGAAHWRERRAKASFMVRGSKRRLTQRPPPPTVAHRLFGPPG